MEFIRFLNSLSKIKNIPLPAEHAQFKMSPPFRKELIKREREKMKNAKQAAVLALFYPDNQAVTRLVLILRKTYHGVHSAQIGFPGGKVEPGDTNLEMTAIRETQEEVGVDASRIEMITGLTELYIPPSNYLVKPFFGITRNTPQFVKEESEVADIVEVSLDDLLDDARVVKERVATSYQLSIEVPAFRLNGHIVWGATAMMLSEIKDLLKAAMP